jgi:hypothetical protein
MRKNRLYACGHTALLAAALCAAGPDGSRGRDAATLPVRWQQWDALAASLPALCQHTVWLRQTACTAAAAAADGHHQTLQQQQQHRSSSGTSPQTCISYSRLFYASPCSFHISLRMYLVSCKCVLLSPQCHSTDSTPPQLLTNIRTPLLTRITHPLPPHPHTPVPHQVTSCLSL